MKIPKYIEESLRIRANSAAKVLTHDSIISKFIESHNIDLDFEDYGLGVEIFGDPYGSAERVREAIINHEE